MNVGSLSSDKPGEAFTPPLLTSARFPLTLHALDDWTRLGFPHYSGQMTYVNELHLSVMEEAVWLELNEAQQDPVEIEVNGQVIGRCCWAPFRLDITDAIQPGLNRIAFRTANTLINRIEGKAQPSGLLGRPRVRLNTRKPLAQRSPLLAMSHD